MLLMIGCPAHRVGEDVGGQQGLLQRSQGSRRRHRRVGKEVAQQGLQDPRPGLGVSLSKQPTIFPKLKGANPLLTLQF